MKSTLLAAALAVAAICASPAQAEPIGAAFGPGFYVVLTNEACPVQKTGKEFRSVVVSPIGRSEEAFHNQHCYTTKDDVFVSCPSPSGNACLTIARSRIAPPPLWIHRDVRASSNKSLM